MNKYFVLIFALSVILRLWFNFFDAHANATFACDAAEYLRDAQGLALSLTKLFGQPQSIRASIQVLSGHGMPYEIAMVKNIFAPMQEMSISGPVFPMFLLICYKLFGQDPSFAAWMIPIGIQCILSALTAGLIASIGNTCWGKSTGIIAGILAAFYPGFIVNSGRLYSESFACFLTCLALWLIIGYLINGRTHYNWGLLLGICLFSLQSTRSIMVILSLAVLGFIVISACLAMQRRISIVKYMLAMVAAFLICLLPWLTIQKLAFGKACLIVDRVGNYNFFMGNNVDTLGWLSVPYPDSTGMEKASHWQLLRQAIHRSPERWFKLMLDKPVRLLKLPWNDFKVWIGPISPFEQAIFHQLILVFATIGLIFIWSYQDIKYERAKILASSIVLFVFLLHFVYLAFITVPRYNLTAMPELILFAGAGLALTIKALRSRQSVLNAIRLLLAIILLMLMTQLDIIFAFAAQFATAGATIMTTLALSTSIILKTACLGVFFWNCWQLTNSKIFSRRRHYTLIFILLLTVFISPAYCLPLRAHGRWYEWSDDFQFGHRRFDRLLYLNKQQYSKLARDGGYLAVNLKGGSQLPAGCDLYVNDIKLSGPFIPALSMAQDLSLVHLNNNLAYTIEQESILGILCGHSLISPLDLRQWYLIPISSSQGKRIVENIDQTHLYKGNVMLPITIYRHTGAPCTIYGAYPFDRNFSIMPSIFRFSWEKAFYGVENEDGLNDPAYDQKIPLHQSNDNAYIKVLIPSLSQNKQVIDSLCLTQQEYKQANFTDRNLILSFEPKTGLISSAHKNNYWLVRLFGEVGRNGACKIKLESGLNFSRNIPYITPWVPDYLQSNSAAAPTKFDICYPVMINAFPGQLKQIELHLTKEPNSINKNALVKCSLEIYQTATLPPGVRYEIF